MPNKRRKKTTRNKYRKVKSFPWVHWRLVNESLSELIRRYIIEEE